MPFDITAFSITAPEETLFVKPVRINYIQNGKARSWEAVQSHDSVSVLLYHREKEAFLLVKQFRPPVFMNDENHNCTYELCAGIIDKSVSLKQIVKEEIEEECGYDVGVETIEKITTFFTNVGVSGSKQHLFYAEIDASMKLHDGGGIETEEIVLEWIPLEEARTFIYDESKAKTPGLMFAFYWFFEKMHSMFIVGEGENR